MEDSLFRFDNKKALVIGGASGMGAAVASLIAKLGGEIIVMDVAEVSFPVAQSIQVDLRNKQSVDEGLAAIEGNIDVVFACAGVADGVKGVTLINFISQRYIVQTLIEKGQLSNGGSILMISSVAGLSWERQLGTLKEFLDCTEWDAALEWVESHPGSNSYLFSKQAINAYVATRAFPLLKKGIRINAVMPGPTDTPLARANADMWLGFGKGYRDALGLDALLPSQIAGPMAFLASSAASGVTGVNLLVDYGHVSSGMVDSYKEPMVKMLLGMS